MTDIEQKALGLVNDLRRRNFLPVLSAQAIIGSVSFPALRCAIEQHEAFRQEVSDALKGQFIGGIPDKVARFIIPEAKPDPLEKLLQSIAITLDANDLREALDEAGLEIREKGE